MLIGDFLPFTDNEKMTAEKWNFLFNNIKSGEFFLGATGSTGIAEDIQTFAGRLTTVEEDIAALESIQTWRMNREQEALGAGQTGVQLAYAPILDTEMPTINGIGLSKSGIPTGYTGDYSVSGSRIAFSAAKAAGITGGDIFSIVYQFEVE